MQSMLPAVRVFGPALAGIISSIHPDCRIGLRRQDIADRVVLFIDYQNVYKTAREAFHSRSAPHWYGQIDPVALGELIVARSPFERTLSGVRIYRGIQDSAKDPKGYAASRRQITAWSRYMRVEVLTRTLRYPSGWPREKPMEKGIDVSLALDYALMAYRQEYDVGILMSTDTDLKPALEAVVDLVEPTRSLESPGHQEPQDLVPLARSGRLHQRAGPAGLLPAMTRHLVAW